MEMFAPPLPPEHYPESFCWDIIVLKCLAPGGWLDFHLVHSIVPLPSHTGTAHGTPAARTCKELDTVHGCKPSFLTKKSPGSGFSFGVQCIDHTGIAPGANIAGAGRAHDRGVGRLGAHGALELVRQLQVLLRDHAQRVRAIMCVFSAQVKKSSRTRFLNAASCEWTHASIYGIRTSLNHS